MEEEVRHRSASMADAWVKKSYMNTLQNSSPKLVSKIGDIVNEYAFLTQAKNIEVVDQSQEAEITDHLLKQKLLIKLNETSFPNSFLYRSPPFDVARSEKDTYICTNGNADDVGITNNWLNSKVAMDIAKRNLKGSMQSKTLYVVPYWLGPYESPFGQGGIELTDSLYVVLNLIKITRVGKRAMECIMKTGDFVIGLHSTANLDPENRYIMHFPEENEGMGLIIGFNTNYGGNALLSKKCHALRIASFKARKEGWMAEHMMLLGLKEPSGRVTYISGAFPSSSGKTNLSMLEPPIEYSKKGWETSLISDDITWMHNDNGKLRGINPEYGFFGVAPHTSFKTNPRAMRAVSSNTLFTNVGITENNLPYWEGINMEAKEITDWMGNRYDGTGNIAHPNSRFSTPIHQYPNLSPDYENPSGAPVSAFLFGGRRSDLIPLVMQAKTWNEGVLYGAMQRIETTAAAIGKVGELRNDPMAMKPFMPYNVGEYFEHYLKMGKTLKSPPGIFNINWFRKGKDGKFLWPGYGENIRVLEWIAGRVNGDIKNAVDTPMGYIPILEDMNTSGIPQDHMAELLTVDSVGFLKEFESVETFFKSIGDRFPAELWDTYYEVRTRLEESSR